MARLADVELQCMAAFFGGAVAQEVLKTSGKLTPIKQRFNYSMVDVLPELTPADNQPIGSRYDGLIQVFGHSIVQKLGELKILMVLSSSCLEPPECDRCIGGLWVVRL